MKKDIWVLLALSLCLASCSAPSASSFSSVTEQRVSSSSASVNEDGYIVLGEYRRNTEEELKAVCATFPTHSSHYLVLADETETFRNNYTLYGFDNVKNGTKHISVERIDGIFGPVRNENKSLIEPYVRYRSFGCEAPGDIALSTNADGDIEAKQDGKTVAVFTVTLPGDYLIRPLSFVERYLSSIAIDA